MGPRSRRTCTLVLSAVAIAACGGNDPSLPDACKRGPAAVRSALRAAPRPVRLDGVPLSRCVSEASDAGELQASGASLVGAAGGLAAGARRSPGGADELRLGYLVGAAARGAGPEGGERSELLRRLEQEADALRQRGAAFRRGLEAGRRDG